MSTLPALTGNCVVKAAPDQVCSDLGGETVILNLKSGTYYGLNPTGTFVWNLIQEPKTIEDLRTAILSEYEVDAAVCDRDLKSLLQKLMEQSMIEVIDAKNIKTGR